MAKISAVFDLQVTPMLPTEFQVNWPFGSGEEAKNRGHLGFLIRTILAFCIYKSPQLILLEFNDTSTLVGHFVSSPRETR